MRRATQPLELGGEGRRVRVVRGNEPLVRTDERIACPDASRARVELVHERQNTLLVRDRHVEAFELTPAQGVNDGWELTRRGEQRLVRVRKIQRQVCGSVHRRAPRVRHRVPDDRESARAHSDTSRATETAAIGATSVTFARMTASVTRTWIASPARTSSEPVMAVPSSPVAIEYPRASTFNGLRASSRAVACRTNPPDARARRPDPPETVAQPRQLRALSADDSARMQVCEAMLDPRDGVATTSDGRPGTRGQARDAVVQCLLMRGDRQPRVAQAAAPSGRKRRVPPKVVRGWPG